MKRSMILALAMSFLLVSGCADATQKTPVPAEQSAPSQNRPAQPSPVQTPEIEVAAEEDIPPSPVQQPLYSIPSGVWLAGNDLGYSSYYYFDAQTHSGSYVSLDYGLSMPFTYSGSGSDLIFDLGEQFTTVTASVEYTNQKQFTLVWDDALPETFTFVGEGTLEDFHFFSNNELARMAAEHYTRSGEDTPGDYGVMTNEDNTVTVQLYDEQDGRNSTAAWYLVDRFTATGTDLMTGEQIDLLAYEEVPDEATDTEEPAEEVTLPEEAVPEESLPGETLPAEELPAPPEAPVPGESQSPSPAEPESVPEETLAQVS